MKKRSRKAVAKYNKRKDESTCKVCKLKWKGKNPNCPKGCSLKDLNKKIWLKKKNEEIKAVFDKENPFRPRSISL